jgi:hypothetical protein
MGSIERRAKEIDYPVEVVLEMAIAQSLRINSHPHPYRHHYSSLMWLADN